MVVAFPTVDAVAVDSTTPTLTALVGRYLVTLSHLRPYIVSSYTRQLAGFLAFCRDRQVRTLPDLEQTHLRAYLDTLPEPDQTLVLFALRDLYLWADEQDLLQGDLPDLFHARR